MTDAITKTTLAQLVEALETCITVTTGPGMSEQLYNVPKVIKAISDGKAALAAPQTKVLFVDMIAEHGLAEELKAMDVQPEPKAVPRRVATTAPARIWLTVSDEPDDIDADFNNFDLEGVCWAMDEALAVNVQYIRADLVVQSDHFTDAGNMVQPVKQANDWEIRGKLTALKCWHRLTEAEADDLVVFTAMLTGAKP